MTALFCIPRREIIASHRFWPTIDLVAVPVRRIKPARIFDATNRSVDFGRRFPIQRKLPLPAERESQDERLPRRACTLPLSPGPSPTVLIPRIPAEMTQRYSHPSTVLQLQQESPRSRATLVIFLVAFCSLRAQIATRAQLLIFMVCVNLVRATGASAVKPA